MTSVHPPVRGTALTLTVGQLLLKRSLTAAAYLGTKQAVTEPLLQKQAALMPQAPESQTNTKD